MLKEALSEEGYDPDLENIYRTGLAEAVVQKGALRDEFNQMMWGLLERWITNLVD